MRVGIGSTVLAKGLHSGHIDGIGTYTSELLKAYDRLDDQDAYMPVVFGAKRRAAIPKAQALNGPYSASALVSAVSGLPFLGSSNLAKSIDLFHATDHHIPKLGKTPVIATIMDVIGLRHPEWVNPTLRGLKNRLFAKATTWAESIVTISDFSALDIADCLGVDPRKIESIPLGVDSAYFDVVAEPARQEVRKRYGLRPGYFVFVGTLQPRKNVARLLAAHAALPADVRTVHPLVIIGQNGWRSEGLLQALGKLEASGNGRWLKYVPRADIFALLQSAQALVFPSMYEGFGLPVLEGFASRIPVVTSNTTSLPEVAGDAALLVDPQSVDEIADAMLQTVEHAGLRDALVARGLIQAQAFTWQATAARTLAAYRRCLP